MISAKTEILIEGLTLHCHVGVPKAERGTTQPVLADIRCTIELPVDGRDQLDATVNYAAIVRSVKALVAEKRFVLLELLAEGIARICFEHRPIIRVTVKLLKPRKLPDCDAVGVERTFIRG